MKHHPALAGLLLPILATASALMASPPAAAQEFSLRLMPLADSISSLSIQQLLIDNQGDLWMATDGGLLRYDGSSFRVYYGGHDGIPRQATQALVMSPSGQLYARTDQGLFAGSATGFTELRTAQGSVRTDMYTPLAAESDRRLLFVRDRQLFELMRPDAAWLARPLFAPTVIAAHPQLRDIRSLLFDDQGALWFGCGEQLCRLRGERLDLWGADGGVPAGSYTSLLQDPQGRLWARSPSHLVALRRGAPRFEVRDPPDAEVGSSTRLLMLALDPQRRLITRTGHGIAVLDGERWIGWNTGNGLPDHGITQAVVDHEGNFWLGVQGIGLYQWPGYGSIESWTRRQGLDMDAVHSIVRDRGHRLILGTDAGCRMLDESSRRIVQCPWSGLPKQGVLASAVDTEGNYWVSYQGAQLWQVPAGGTRARQVTSMPEGVNATVLLFDRPGTGYLAAGEQGLLRIDTLSLAQRQQPLPPGIRVDDITHAADGTLWVATTGGLYALRDGRYSLVPTLFEGEQLNPDTVTTTPDGEVWTSRIGSPILHMTHAGGTHPTLDWQAPEGMGLRTLYSLHTDRRGWIWANTGRGVGVYDGQVWRQFGVEDGLVWTDTTPGALYADDDGSIWVGTRGGLTHIRDPQRWIHDTSRPVQLHLSDAMFGRVDLLQGGVHLPWHSDTALDLSFAARAFEISPLTELRYRLLGLSSQWYASRSFNVHIPALAPGHYELEAVAVDQAHARNSQSLRLVFDVDPPWWATRLFRAAAVLAAAVMLLLLWRWQQQRWRNRQARLERRQREHRQLLERATRDALTGVWNRGTVLELLSGEMQTARRSGTALAVALVDADHFKAVNDSLGHPAGDEVLKQLTQRLHASFRQRDLIGRYGGEEFLVVMPGLSEDAHGTLLESVRKSIADLPFDIAGVELAITVSIGVAWMTPAEDTSTDLIRRADHALYEAKGAGRNRVMYSPSSLSNSQRRVRARPWTPAP